MLRKVINLVFLSVICRAVCGQYGFRTTAKEVAENIDLSGKVAIVTGATAGLGLETSKTLVRNGAKVIITGRTKEKAEKAKDKIESDLCIGKNSKRIIPMALDLCSISSIESFCKQFKKLKLPLHLLINNAGVMMIESREVTEDGFEVQMGTNHLGHFHLTNLLLGSLKKSAPSRIVVVSSLAHRFADVAFLDDAHLKSAKFGTAYGNSKLANIMHAAELDKRIMKDGVRAFSVHPGTIQTELFRHFPKWAKLLAAPVIPFLKTVEQGAATQVFAALRAKETEGGKYFENCQVGKLGFPPIVEDEEKRRKFWQTSLQLIQSAKHKNKSKI